MLYAQQLVMKNHCRKTNGRRRSQERFDRFSGLEFDRLDRRLRVIRRRHGLCRKVRLRNGGRRNCPHL